MTGEKTHRIKVALLFLVSALGCGVAGDNESTWYTRHNWRRTEVYSGAEMISLCEAIEANDVQTAQHLLEEEADINRSGRNNITPLVWAVPNDNEAMISCLLHGGADPNIPVSGQVGKGDPDTSGRTATILVGIFGQLRNFELIMTHGGDPNAVDQKTKKPLLTTLITHSAVKDRHAKVELLVSNFEPNMNSVSQGLTPAMHAVSRGYLATAVHLLDSGANPNIYAPRSNQKLIHVFARQLANPRRRWNESQRKFIEELTIRLEKNGDSIKKASEDITRWQEWGRNNPPEKFRELMDREIAERIERDGE